MKDVEKFACPHLRAKVEEWLSYKISDQFYFLRSITDEYDGIKPRFWQCKINGVEHFMFVGWEQEDNYSVPFNWLLEPDWISYDTITVSDVKPKHGEEVKK